MAAFRPMELTHIWIIVGKRIRPAQGHLRGDMVMVPSEHGPLYFHRPYWHETKAAAEAHVAQKVRLAA